MRIIGFFLTIVVLIIGIAFAALNANVVEINYLIGTKNLPLVASLLVSMAIGIIISALFLGINVITLKAKYKLLENKLKKTQAELLKSNQEHLSA